MEPFILSKLMVVSSLVILSLACLLTIPAARIWTAHRFFRHGTPKLQPKQVYCDEDGEANDELCRWSSGKWQRVTALLSSIVGLSASLVSVFLDYSHLRRHNVVSTTESGIWVSEVRLSGHLGNP